MIYLFPTQILYLHKRVIEASGGSHGVRDEGLLESAVYRPQATFGGSDLYPDLLSKAAALGQSTIKNRPFIDGNKRTGLEAMRLMLRLNGRDMRVSEDERFNLAVRAARSDVDEHQIAEWLAKNCVSKKTR